MSVLSLQSFLRYCCLPGTSMSGSKEKRKLPHNFWEKLTDFPFAPAQSSWLFWAHFWHVPRAKFRKETPSWRRWFSAMTRIATTSYMAAGQCQAGSLVVQPLWLVNRGMLLQVLQSTWLLSLCPQLAGRALCISQPRNTQRFHALGAQLWWRPCVYQAGMRWGLCQPQSTGLKANCPFRLLFLSLPPLILGEHCPSPTSTHR